MLGASVLYFSGLVLSVYLYSKFVSHQRHAAFSQQNGCKAPPAIQQNKWLNGADVAFKFMNLLREKTYLHQTSLFFQDTARTFTIQFFGATRIWTIDPENIKTILQSDDFEMGWVRNKALRPYIGNGMQANNGAIWAHGRALLRPSFHRAQISNLDLYEEHFQNFAVLVPANGSTIDLQKAFHRLAMDVSTDILFGESARCLQPVMSKEAQELEAAFNYATKGIFARFNMGNLIWLHWDPKFTRSVRIVQNYVQRFVEKALQVREVMEKSDDKADDDGNSRKGRYVFLEALAKDTGDRLMLRDQLLSMMAAGRSNTASLLSLVFYLLARNSSALQTLRDEIATLKNQPPTFDQLKAMPYLRAVLDETLRVHPSAPINERAAKRATILPRGGGPDGRSPVAVRKGQTVFYHTYALHRSQELWGGDAAEFRPERWLELRRNVGDGETVNRKANTGTGTAWRFVPFGGGARVCPGQTLALTEASYFTVRILQTFSKLENRDFLDDDDIPDTNNNNNNSEREDNRANEDTTDSQDDNQQDTQTSLREKTPAPFVEGLGVVFNSARGVKVSLGR